MPQTIICSNICLIAKINIVHDSNQKWAGKDVKAIQIFLKTFVGGYTLGVSMWWFIVKDSASKSLKLPQYVWPNRGMSIWI